MRKIREIYQSLSGGGFKGIEQKALISTVGINHTNRKNVAQTVAASTTFVNDNALFAELPVGEHVFRIQAPLSMAAASNIKIQFIAAEGFAVSAIKATAWLYATTVAPTLLDIAALSSSVNGGAAQVWTNLVIEGSVAVTAQGILQFQWAQASSGVTATEVLVGSTLQTFQVLP